MSTDPQKIIENAWDNRELLTGEEVRKAIAAIIEDLDKGGSGLLRKPVKDGL